MEKNHSPKSQDDGTPTTEQLPTAVSRTDTPLLNDFKTMAKWIFGVSVLLFIVGCFLWKPLLAKPVAETAGKATWTYLVPLLAPVLTFITTILAAYLGLKQFDRTHFQREKQFTDQLSAARKQFEEKADADRIQFDIIDLRPLV